MEKIYKRFIYNNSFNEKELKNGMSIFKAFKENISDIEKLNLHIIIHGNYIDSKLNDIHKNTTINNHIIQASYFSQWTCDYKINKNKTVKQQRVLIKGSHENPKLDNYMQKNFGLHQFLENYFTGKDLPVENKELKKYVNSEILQLKLIDQVIKEEGLDSFYFKIMPKDTINIVKFAFFYYEEEKNIKEMAILKN